MISVYVSLGIVPHAEERPRAHALLAECLKAAGADYVFGQTPLTLGKHGKPSLADRPDIHYNLSHAKGIRACMTAPDECGIDCESVRKYKPRVAERVFSHEEQALLAAAPEAERDMLFFRLWTLKEAYVKAIGVGIGFPMNKVSFTLSGGGISSNVPNWHFAQFIINGTAIVSLCTSSQIDQTVTRLDTENDLLVLNVPTV